jgi:RNA polymerase sigma-70 factor (ECF subfamily)
MVNVREWAQPLPIVTSDEDARQDFEARLADSSSLVFRVAYSVLRQREDAEDVAQEAFARAYRSFHALRERERFRAWIVRAAWRLAIDRVRANRRRVAREQPLEVLPDPGVAPDVEARARHAHLWAAIDELPEPQRIVTIKWRLFAARKTLQEKLQWMNARD